MRFKQRRQPQDPARATVRHRGRTLTFAIDNPKDTVQRHLSRGVFYESDLLRSHADLIFRRSTVLDVGANIGNHATFYALTRAAKVYPFEPNPRAQSLLRTTVNLNELPAIDLSYVDHGLAAAPGEMYVHTPGPNNLGRTMLRPDGDLKVQVSRLDDLDLEGRVSFLKVDVEGMELDVLAGAAGLIEEHRPGLGIEVHLDHVAAFWEWLEAHDYHVTRAVRMYAENVNYVCIPRR